MSLHRTQPKRLGDYVERAYLAGSSKPNQELGPRPFSNATARDTPFLQRREVNRIMLFPGSFNPLHKGHLDLLRYVFENARDDLNIIAAMIVMTDEEQLEHKLSEEADPLILSRAQRVKLWRDKGLPTSWAWVFDKSQAEWASFRSRLERSTRKDGIELKFILLGGPDCIGYDNMADPSFWNCKDCITSDVSRPVDFRCANSMRQLSAHTIWKRVAIERSKVEYHVRARMYGNSTATIGVEVSRVLAKLEESWTCDRYFPPKGMVRFVPSDLGVRTSNPPSSTSIRNIINTIPIESLQLALENLTINTELLVAYVRQRPPPRPRVRVVKISMKSVEELEKEELERWNNIAW